jgi:hypothetical protein
MVLTHKSMEQKSRKRAVVPVPFNPARAKMTKAEVLREKEIERERIKRIKEAEAKINEDIEREFSEEVKDSPEEQPAPHPVGQSIGERVAELESLMASAKGPGSKAKKAKYQADIDRLKAQQAANDKLLNG